MIGSSPVANGSSVPRCPTRAGFTRDLTRRTTSADEIPAGLSTNTIAFMREIRDLSPIAPRSLKSIRSAADGGDTIIVVDATEKHVVIIGGGFGGIEAARALKRAPVRLTMIDRRNHHLFQPLLYQVATAALNPSDIASPIRRILRRQRNASVILGEAVVDRHAAKDRAARSTAKWRTTF